MSYSTEAADLLTKQLKKFATLNRHQLASQAANFDFWIAEVEHCLATIDGYESRFSAMKKAQHAYVTAHQTVEFNVGQSYWKAQPARSPFKFQPMCYLKHVNCFATQPMWISQSLPEGRVH